MWSSGRQDPPCHWLFGIYNDCHPPSYENVTWYLGHWFEQLGRPAFGQLSIPAS